jgi:hypothetical protein
LADAGVQSSAAILIQEFGYALTADDFFLDPAQVYPFLKR